MGRKPISLLTVLCLGGAAAACATAPAPDSGYLSSYDNLQTRSDTVRASVRQRRDDALAAAVERIRIERAEMTAGAAEAFEPDDRSLVLDELDRQLCYQLSRRFTVVEDEGADVGRVRVAATRVSPTSPAGSAASAAANWFIPGPIGVRAPGSTGGLAAEAELLAPDGRQVAALVWARNATVIGTDNPSLSRVGDAHRLAKAFSDMTAEAFAPPDRPVRPVPDPDPCARHGPRNRPEGFVTRAITGLYQPELSGGRRQPAEEDSPPDAPSPR